MTALLYTASAANCRPNSLSQEVGLGAQAGLTRFRRAAETPLNLILEARP